MRQKINMVTLGVKDLNRAIDFYEKGLGWKKASASDGNLVVFQLGNVVLALYPRDLLAEDAQVKDSEPGFSGMTLSYNARDEAEVDAVLKEVEALGATIVKTGQKVFWGGYGGYFKDPEGHLIEVAYNPFWELDENGDLKLK
jgi:uncharacterized protein